MPEFNPENFRGFIARRGERIIWRRSHQCACLDPVSRLHNRSCPRCDGLGYTYEDGVEMQALVRQVDARDELAKFGKAVAGDITVSTMPDVAMIGSNDMIELPDRTFRYEENINASGTEADVLHYTRAALLEYVASVEKTYSISTECILNVAGNGIIWLTTYPGAGTQLSIAYLRIPQYIVEPGLIATRRKIGGSTGTQMPQRISAKLLNREDFR